MSVAHISNINDVKSVYKGKSLNNRNFILKCMENYAQLKILFWDTKWPLSNMSYGVMTIKQFEPAQ